MRVFVDLFFFVVVLYLVDGVVNERSRPWWASSLCAVSLLCAFLFSADTGMYSTVALIIVVAASAVLNWKSGQVVIRLSLFGLLTLASFAALGIAANVILGGGPLAYRFLRDADEIVSNYRWAQASPMAMLDTKVLAWTAAVGFFIVLAAWFGRDSQSEALTRRPLFLLSAPLFALILLQSALVRSDWGHITMGLLPVIFFALAVLLGAGTASTLRDALCVFLAIGLTGMVAGPFFPFLPRNIRANVANLANYSFRVGISAANCSGAYLDHVCFGLPEGKTLALTTAYVQQHTPVGDSILIYPYENEVGVAARRMVAGAVLQNYTVAGDYLVRRQLQGVEAQRPSHGLYFVDGPQVYQIDDVTNFSRTPLVWFYMQSHYRSEAEPAPGVFALVHDENRALQTRQQSTPLAGVERSVGISENPQIIDLGPVQWPQEAEVLKLKLTMHYSALWKLRKPSQLAVELELADGSRKQTHLVIPPNNAYDVWVYPWDEKTLGMFLDPIERNWRGNIGPSVVRVRIIVQKQDWVSAMPTSTTVHGAEAVWLRQ